MEDRATFVHDRLVLKDFTRTVDSCDKGSLRFTYFGNEYHLPLWGRLSLKDDPEAVNAAWTSGVNTMMIFGPCAADRQPTPLIIKNHELSDKAHTPGFEGFTLLKNVRKYFCERAAQHLPPVDLQDFQLFVLPKYYRSINGLLALFKENHQRGPKEQFRFTRVDEGMLTREASAFWSYAFVHNSHLPNEDTWRSK